MCWFYNLEIFLLIKSNLTVLHFPKVPKPKCVKDLTLLVLYELIIIFITIECKLTARRTKGKLCFITKSKFPNI